jgi:large subunit ribosomal protein L25
VSLTAQRRTETGKGAARQIRSRGRIPAVIYGHGREPEALSISAMELDKALHGVSAESTVIDLAVDGAGVQTLIREIQRHPTRMSITHVDFYEIHAGEKITLDIPVRFVGSPDGVRNAGGVLEQFLREIAVEVLPQDIPHHIDVDVTDLGVAQSLHVADISVPNAKILSDLDQTICTVVPPRVEEEVPVEVVEEVEAAEPELIRKPRGEVEEEAAPDEQPEE